MTPRKFVSHSLLILIILFVDKTASKVHKLRQVLSTGTVFEEFDHSTVSLYDTVFPLIYSYKGPDWFWQRELSASSVPNCSDDSYGGDTGAGGLCPIWFHVGTQLRKEMDFAMGLQFMTSMTESDMDLGLGRGAGCDRVEKHFFVERVQNDKFASYLSRWRRCSEGRIWESDLITEYSGKISTVYATLAKQWMDVFGPKAMRTEARIAKGAELNEKLALAGLLYTHYLALVKRWRRGFRDCKLGLIPDALLSSKRLQTGLDALGRKIGPEFRFAIPHQGSEISRYFKQHSLADCVYTSDRFYLRILIPVVKVRAAPINLVNIRSLPFLREVKGVAQMCMVPGFEKGRLFPTTIEEGGPSLNGTYFSTTTQVQCDPTNFKLCQIPDPDGAMVGKVTQCARALILYDFDPSEKNEAGIVLNCPLNCKDLRDERFPILVRARDESQTIYVISDPKKEDGLGYKCSTATPPTENEDPPPPEEHFLPHPIRDGVLAFFLPCNCTLTIGPTILLPSSIDCPSPPDPVTFRLTPFHFLDPNNTSTSKKMEAAQANTPSPILNPDDAAR